MKREKELTQLRAVHERFRRRRMGRSLVVQLRSLSCDLPAVNAAPSLAPRQS